jgi:WD40 repeat protein/class 3 adenylate cyclase
MAAITTGTTITFLFTDIEGSTRFWEAQPEAMEPALARHDALLREIIESHGGCIFKTIGDAFCAAFDRAPDALEAAHAAQRALHDQVPQLRVRMAVHMGLAQRRDDDYFGPALNHAARLLSAGHGGQVLLSQATAEEVARTPPADTELRPLGRHQLRDIADWETIFQLQLQDLPARFPALNTLDVAFRRGLVRATAIAAVVLAVVGALALLAARNARVARSEAKRAQQQTLVANQRAEDLAWEDYINRVNRAYREVQDANIALAEDLLQGCPPERRGWEWHHVNRLCHPERLSVEVPGGAISAIEFSPDGRRIATSSGGPFAHADGVPKVALWDRGTGQRRLTLRGTERLIWSLAFSPDGTRLALGGASPQVQVRDPKTGRILWAKQERHLPQATSVTFSPDGRSLAVGFGEYSAFGAHPVKIYDAATGKERVTFPGPRGGVNDLAFHPDGRRLAVAGWELVAIWDVVGHTKLHELRGHTNWVYGVAFSPDGKWLATGGWDRTIKLREAATGAERLTLFAHEGFVLDLAFSPDSRTLASTSEDRRVRLWEVPTGRLIGALHGHTDFAQAVAFAPDGRELASGGLEGSMKIWDRRTSLPIAIKGHRKGVIGLWYRRDGRRVVTLWGTGSGPAIPKGWDPETGELDPALTRIARTRLGEEYLPYAIAITPGVPFPAAISPDGRLRARVLRTSMDAKQGEKRSKSYATSAVEVLDVATDRLLHTLVGHTADVVRITFSPDGRRIATASYDQTVKIWDTATGREVFTLRGHTAGVISVAFSPDGHRLVSGGLDDAARVWNATPLPAGDLRAREARYQQKQTELKLLREHSPVDDDARGSALRARNEQWDASAEELRRVVESDPNNLSARCLRILTLAAAGDRAQVRLNCDELLRRFGDATEPAQAASIAWHCALAPDAISDVEAPIRLAMTALAGCPEGAKSEVLNTLGAALYRAGRYEAAIRRLNESIRTRGGASVPKQFVFLAMAHHRLGHRGEARRWLDRLENDQPKEGFEFLWDEVELRILRREAELLVSGSPAAPRTSSLR